MIAKNTVFLENFFASEEGILTGGGGGFVIRFSDFVIGPHGETTINHYTLDPSSEEPVDIQSARLLLSNRESEFSRLMKMAVDIGFFDIDLEVPTSETVRHTAVVHPEYGFHQVVWATGVEPTPPDKLVSFDKEIRTFLTVGFNQEFGN